MNTRFTPIVLATVFSISPLLAQNRDRQAATPTPPRPARGTPPAPKTTGDYGADVVVVRDAQEQALEQTRDKQQGADGATTQAALDAAVTQMEKALLLLEEAKKSPEKLAAALSAQQAAYQALLKLAAREHQVSQSRSRSKGAGQQANQQQLEQLDLKQAEDKKYETQRQAAPQQNPEQREQLQVQNRLKELAQRQQDLNERIKELQNSLAETKTEEEREEIRRRLKRLREEEQEMLADVDELRQRMEQPQNQSKMAESRQQLDQTRAEVQKAAEALEKESASQALAAGARAQRELQQLREDFRQQNAKQFSEEMRQMRNEARQLAQKQEEIGQKLANLGNARNQPKSLTDSGEKKALTDQLQQQQSGLTNLLGGMRSLSEKSETAEPLLSKQLYDTLRKTEQAEGADAVLPKPIYDALRDKEKGSVENSLGIASELLDKGVAPLAEKVEQLARQQIDQLRQGVERAAESVLGDDTEALRRAKRELDDLARQLENELGAGEPKAGANAGQSASTNSSTNLLASAGAPQGANGTNAAPAPGQGERPGQTAQNSANRNGEQPGGQAGQNGQQPGQQPGQPSQEGRGQSPQPGKAGPGQGQQPGTQPQPGQNPSGNQPGQTPGQQPGQGEQPGSPGQSGNREQAANPSQRPGQRNGQGRGGANSSEAARDFLSPSEGGNSGRGGTGPITGEDFVNWSDRLRDVEEMMDQPELRNEVARVRERARVMRAELKRQSKTPDRDQIQTQLALPLAEVRNRVAEELAKRESKDALVPIDRDPVPNKFSELVRRYYEKLGVAE